MLAIYYEDISKLELAKKSYTTILSRIFDTKHGFNIKSLDIYRKHSKKCTFYTLRFGCSFAAVNTIKPQLL